jgi:hypothetical protein
MNNGGMGSYQKRHRRKQPFLRNTIHRSDEVTSYFRCILEIKSQCKEECRLLGCGTV